MKQTAGFTLIELMVTVAVLAVIASLAIPAYRDYVTTARFTEAQNEISAIILAQEEFFLDNGNYFGPVLSGADPSATSENLYLTQDASLEYFSIAISNAPCADFATCYRITATGKGALSGETVTFDGP